MSILKTFGLNEDLLTEDEISYYSQLGDIISFASTSKVNKNSILNDQRINSTTVRNYGEYTADEVAEALADPSANETTLREVARYLFNTNRLFKVAVEYYPSIAMYCPVAIPTRVGELKGNTMKIQYENVTKYLNKLNLPKEFDQVTTTCCLEDVFYGIEYEDENSYFIKPLHPDYCRISSMEYGCYNFQFDVTFFDKLASNDVDTTLLDEYDLYIKGFFTKAYNSYKSTNDQKLRWVEVPAQNSICMKWHNELDYLLPPYASIYSDIQSIEDYKALSLVSEEQANYKIIGFKIPRLENDGEPKPDNWAVKLTTATMFFNLARNQLSDTIGMFYTPMEFEQISFSGSQTNSRNKVQEATDSLFDSLGHSKLLFNSDNATTLKYSIQVDQGRLFKFYRQLETWVTRKLFYNFKGNWRCQMVDATEHNKEDLVDQYLKLGQYGVPIVPYLCAIVGMNQTDTIALNYIQNDILDIQNAFIPLVSSNTQTGDESENNGRPASKTGSEKSNSTIANKEAGTDAKKG